MTLQLEHIRPLPLLQGKQLPASEIWGKNISFQRGHFCLIQAPSGKGKSTLLHILYGLRQDFRGQVLLDKKDTSKFSMADWQETRRTKLSIVFQDLRLFPQLTALENIQIKSALAPHKNIEQILGMCEALDIRNLLDQKAASLSYGQQQRVAIIRALCQPFSFLLLDEPFSHLDEKNIQNATELIRQETRAQGAGLILVNLGEASAFSFQQIKQL